MTHHLLQVAHRIEFWGAIIDAVGLTILLSYDLAWLRKPLMRIPSLRKRHDLVCEVKRLCAAFEKSHPPVAPRRELMQLNGEQAHSFVTLFDDYDRSLRSDRSSSMPRLRMSSRGALVSGLAL
jgi:hypothetical protein